MEPANPSGVVRVPRALTLRITPVVEQAAALASRMRRDMPDHPGLASLCDGVELAAREAQTVARTLRRPLGLHRLPALFMLLVVAGIGWIIYHQLLHVSRLTIGLSDRDSVQLRRQIDRRVQFSIRKTSGSRDSLALLARGELDIAVVQGGVDVQSGAADADPWLVRELPGDEVVLLFTRGGAAPRDLKRILTSAENQGSHTVARELTKCWGNASTVTYLHAWQALATDPAFVPPPDVDGVLVVKDLASAEVDVAARTLAKAGFRLVPPYVGGHAQRLRWLRDTPIKAGYVSVAAGVPTTEIASYAVSTYMVINPHLSPRQLAAADNLARDQAAPLAGGFELTIGNTSELLQGIEAGLGILVYLGVAFLAVLGLDVYTYQSRFSDLNSLVSLITLHQSTRGGIHASPERRAADVRYLRVCSDLLGLISVISGYYTQENSSLSYNRMLEVIHNRASALKLNIQLKILHALIDLPVPPEYPDR